MISLWGVLQIPRREGDDTVAADDDPAPADDVGAYVYPSMLKGGKADKTQNYKLNQEASIVGELVSVAVTYTNYTDTG